MSKGYFQKLNVNLYLELMNMMDRMFKICFSQKENMVWNAFYVRNIKNDKSFVSPKTKEDKEN